MNVSRGRSKNLTMQPKEVVETIMPIEAYRRKQYCATTVQPMEVAVDGPPAILVKCTQKGKILLVVTTMKFGELCEIVSPFMTPGGWGHDHR